ncbi:MAG: GNAT family N-acetyltransferase [Kofleriaceae bacterium]
MTTARLVLRPPVLADFEGWASMMADPVATEHLGGPQPRAVAWRSFCTMAGAWALQGFAMFTVLERATGRWLGRIGPWQPEGWPGTEVGWGLARQAWGQGYATEAATCAIDWAFDTLGWDEVIHAIAPSNLPSRALAERLGSTLRGPGRLPPPHGDAPIDIWGQDRATWRARRG